MDAIYKALLVLWYIGYTPNIENISVTGRVTDFNSGMPMANTEIIVTGYVTEGPDYSKKFEKDVVTDTGGYYSVKFDVGYKIVVAADVDGYYPARNESSLKGNHTPVLDLQIEKLEPEDKLILNGLSSYLPWNDSTIPGISYGIYFDSVTDKPDFNTVEFTGYDFINSTRTKDTLNADLWCRYSHTLGAPQVFVAGERGGILPIFHNEIKSMAEFEKRLAPDTGYVKEYRLTGEERGFFIKCRNGETYAKLFFSAGLNKSRREGKGYIKEYGFTFYSFYQPDGTRNFRYYKKLTRMELIEGFR